MRRGWGKRALSLALALELLCAPLAMARAEDPARMREEIPLGEEAGAVQDTSADLPVSGDLLGSGDSAPGAAIRGEGGAAPASLDLDEAADFVVPSGLADEKTVLHHLGLSYGLAYSANRLERYQGYLKQESDEYFNDWGYGGGKSTGQYVRTLALGVDGYFYFCLPEMGRVPDLELEGLYLYPDALTQTPTDEGSRTASWLDDATALRGWSYDESTCVRLELEAVPEDYVEETLYNMCLAEPSSSYTLVRFPAQREDGTELIDETVAYHYTPEEGVRGAQQWSVPVVARWVESDQSDMALFTLDVNSTARDESRAVEELYTKPIREAGADDLLRADPDYSVTYAAQSEEELGTNSSHEETRTATAFTPDPAQGEIQHYYLRVDEEEDSVDLRFWSQEPYYAYHMEDNAGGPSPVSVIGEFEGQNGVVELPFELTSGWGDEDENPFFPTSLVLNRGTRSAQNSVAQPARGQWTAAKIPLKKVSEAADTRNASFNNITVTIQSPSGKAQSVYVFHIERLMTPRRALGYGNTPAGMVMRDDSSLWETEADWGGYAATASQGEGLIDYNKASALNYFTTNHTFRDMPIQPGGQINQWGSIYRYSYDPTAWVSGNTDLDPTAIVIYQDMAFNDPGVSFVDSEGRDVIFGEDAEEGYQTCVTRTLQLSSAPALSVDSYESAGKTCYYYVDEKGVPGLTEDPEKAAQILNRSDGSDPVDLRGLIVLPGVYTATYTFRDPIRPGDDPVTIARTVVVLPIPGDVDMDGAVTSADALALTENTGTWSARSDQLHRLLRTRVYGITVGPVGDEQLLNPDAIRKGFQPILGRTDALGYSDYMYLPLSWDGEDYHLRKTWSEVDDLAGSGAELRLEFLGIEQGTWHTISDQTYTNNISGPWAASTGGDDSGVSIVAGSPTSGRGDVFWMGVYMDDPGVMKGRGIQDISLSLVYDSEYVRPALVHAYNAGATTTDETSRWQITTLLQYNFLAGSKNGDLPMTIFSGRTGSDYRYQNSVMDRAYATHYSKVKGQLEMDYTDESGRLDERKLKEVVFSLQLQERGTAAVMGEGYLLVLPFQLIRHPEARMDGEQLAHLVELSAGMRDFSLVLTSAATSRRSIFAPIAAGSLSAGGADTYAFSAQDDIYGNTTQNIRGVLTYDGSEGLVPIGKDNTVRIELKDSGGNHPVFDQEVSIADARFYEGSLEEGSLPPGLELDPYGATISGRPTRAGVYEFSINGIPYQITVKPRVIHYRAAAAISYYGEREFRGGSETRVGTGLRDFTFTYDRADLAERDQEGARSLNADWTAEGQGDSQELADIFAWEREEDPEVRYTPPAFQAVDKDGLDPVKQKTDIGQYYIVPDSFPSSTNYTFEYDGAGAGRLTIASRPVWIGSLVMTAERSGSRIYNDESGANQDLTAREAAGEELIALVFDDDQAPLQPDGSRLVNDMPLTGPARVAGDVLTLRFAADYVPNDADEEYVRLQQENGGQVSYRFALTEDEELRSLRVTQMDTSFINTSNYVIQNFDMPLYPDECQIEGTVVRRGVEAIAFTDYPGVLMRNPDGSPVIQAYYGDTVHDEDLTVMVTRGAGDGATNVGKYVYNNPFLLPMELHYNWVSPEEMAEGLKPENLETLVGTGWVPNSDGEPEDLHPYNGTTPLTPDMDGWYLCAAVKKYETGGSGEDKYIKVYSDYPVRVNKKTITLTAQPTSRYYGEENGELHYTYNLNDFIFTEGNALRDWVAEQEGSAYASPTLDGAEMERFFREVLRDEDFVPPALEVAKTRAIPKREEDRVTQTTPVGGGGYYVILYGGSSRNYEFAYVNGSETIMGEGAFGYSQMTMMRRPVVIQEIFSPGGDRTGFQTIYSDTKNLFLQDQSAPGTRVSFTLPNHDDETTSFYRSGGDGTQIRLFQTYANPDPVLAQDLNDLTVNYSVRFMCDPGHYRWLSIDNNYYDVDTLREQGGTMEKDVVVADMELQGAAARNYELVYAQAEQATLRAPNDVEAKNYEDPTHQGATGRYLIHGTGTVTLRRVKSIVLQGVGQLEYAYGDPYAPYRSDYVSGLPMTVAVEYETTVDESHNNGDDKLNDHAVSETVTFQVNSGVSNFFQRGLTIYYLKPGQSTGDAIAAGQTLDYTSPMIPDDHNGARLFVADQRRAEDAPILSGVSERALQVTKRSLTFTVQDAHRFYGETLHINDRDPADEEHTGTAAFSYTFPTDQLAQRDQEALAELRGVEVSELPAVSTEADLEELARSLEGTSLRMDLSAPDYTPDPGPAAPVEQDGWGAYPIGITPKNLRNYEVTGVPGTLYVYPRPVWVTDVLTSADDPVYTIYNQSSTMTFTTQLDTQRVVLRRSNEFLISGGWISTSTSPCLCSDAFSRNLPLSGDALLGEDSLVFTVQLWFYDEPDFAWILSDGVTDYTRDQVEITFRGMRRGDASQNYAVSNDSAFSRGGYWGAVKLRSIDEIFITGMPRVQYTYGEALDLSELQVTIRYKALQGLGETNVVNYLGPDSFRAVGLYVNYWYPGDEVPGGRKPSATEDGEKDPSTTTEEEDAQRRALPNAHRRADSGDHLTIAPTHDTQRYLADPTAADPLERPFAANGKYLIISACQDGESQSPATPKILGARVDNVAVDGGVSYESESEPIPIVVTPLQLRYDLSAADKTYDGTTQAAGTLTLENVFDAVTQEKVEETDGVISGSEALIRDVVYVPMGASYEDHGADASDTGYAGYLTALERGVISFTTGRYLPNGEAPLLENGRLDWADGYAWGKGLTFTFANPNVHYLEPGESEPGPIGTPEMAAYWQADQDHNSVQDGWDGYRDVCAMPVEVTGMVLAGPDAANYTWATDGSVQSRTEVTMTTRASETDNQAAAPYATIHKANRATIQSMAGEGLTLPYLQLDEHTNVARLFYGQDLSVMADNNNASGTADDYRDELHFEYALYYEGENGLLTQWAGAQGDRAYQDTTFFGGEFVRPEVDPSYTPDYDRLPLQEDAKEDFVRKGQHYRWAQEDTGLSPLGLREDAGVIRDLSAYPGGAEKAELYYAWYYDLYGWGEEGPARAALPRDTVLYPLVRLSATHNYNPSGCLTGDLAVTAQALDAAQKAVAQSAGAEGGEDALAGAAAASGDVFAAARAMEEAARELSAQRVALDAELAESGKFPEEGRPLIGSAPAVKTFRQRLDILSASWERSGDGEFLIQVLEDVWFTDTMRYPEIGNMDAVVFNSPTRYYQYYWDADKSAQIRFGDDAMPIDFDTVMTVEIRRRQSDGSTEEVLYTYDPDAAGHTAQIYVQTTLNDSQTVRSIRIVPSVVYARVGDGPYQLSVVTTPRWPSRRRYAWSTSDPSVVTVDQQGVLTFRGEGTATITVTTDNGREGTAVVIVSPFLSVTQIEGSLFNFQYPGPWAQLDEDYAFRPKQGMTRGELVELLDLFLDPAAQWQATQEPAYIDVTGREKYYQALKRLAGAGVVVGVPGGAFAGDQLATRAEFVTMLSRMLRLDTADTRGMAHAFADAGEDSTWAYAYIDALAKAGVIRGVGGGEFAPDRVITREETAAIIARLLTTKLDTTRAGLLRPSDMTPENWSYAAVLRAVNAVVYPED